MQLTNALCYALLMITMTSTCIEAEGGSHELEERKIDRRLSRRDATLLIDSIPADRPFHNAKVIYRRISKQRYSPKPKYGPPRPKYGPPKPKASRIPAKKYRGKLHSKYGSPKPNHKKRVTKPRYGSKRPVKKPTYGPPNKKPHSLLAISYRPEPIGFGEPPSFNEQRSPSPDYDDYQKPGFDDYQKPEYDNFKKPNLDIHKPSSSDFYKPMSSDFQRPYSNDFQKPNYYKDFRPLNFDGLKPINDDILLATHGHGEPPVDSYGAPIKPNLHDLTYPTAQSFPDSSSHFDQSAFHSWKSYQQDQNLENRYAFSNKNKAFLKPDDNAFGALVPDDSEEELGLKSYSDIFNYRQMKDKFKKNAKIIRKPWKGSKKQVSNEIIVGGQYAEPPARYINKFHPSAPMFPDGDDFVPQENLADPEIVASATNSPYVNYKNSNMAFSPQNLNDAFSIVDK